MSDYRRLINSGKVFERRLMEAMMDDIPEHLERAMSTAQDSATYVVEMLEYRQKQGEPE